MGKEKKELQEIKKIVNELESKEKKEKEELQRIIDTLGNEFQRLLKTNPDVAFTLAEFTKRLISLVNSKSYSELLKVGELYGKLLVMYAYHEESTDVIDYAFNFARSYLPSPNP